jgi:hypothetical protein
VGLSAEASGEGGAVWGRGVCGGFAARRGVCGGGVMGCALEPLAGFGRCWDVDPGWPRASATRGSYEAVWVKEFRGDLFATGATQKNVDTVVLCVRMV